MQRYSYNSIRVSFPEPVSPTVSSDSSSRPNTGTTDSERLPRQLRCASKPGPMRNPSERKLPSSCSSPESATGAFL